jgi:hypothetical protein
MQDVFEPTANFGGEVFEPMNFGGFQKTYTSKPFREIPTRTFEETTKKPKSKRKLLGFDGLISFLKKYNDVKKFSYDDLLFILDNLVHQTKEKTISNRVNTELENSDFSTRRLNYLVSLNEVTKQDVLNELEEYVKNKKWSNLGFNLLKERVNSYNTSVQGSLPKSEIISNYKVFLDSYENSITYTPIFENFKIKIQEEIKNRGRNDFSDKFDVKSYFAVEEAPIKDSKFLGMPRKVGIGVAIGVGVLAIAGIVFAIAKKKK